MTVTTLLQQLKTAVHAIEIARRLNEPIETVYQQLVRAYDMGLVRLIVERKQGGAGLICTWVMIND